MAYTLAILTWLLVVGIALLLCYTVAYLRDIKKSLDAAFDYILKDDLATTQLMLRQQRAFHDEVVSRNKLTKNLIKALRRLKLVKATPEAVRGQK